MNVLIVDDSVVFRMAISNCIESVDGFNVTGTASNGKIAIDFLNKNPHPDLIILDMEMPVMDGLTTIGEIRKISKDIIIICFSALTSKGAETTIQALNNGANDFVTKQEASSSTLEGSMQMIESVLVPKLNAFKQKKNATQFVTASDRGIPSKASSSPFGVHEIDKSPELILIASSTGGPEALTTIFKGITVTPKIPILLVQHMPPIFTNTLAKMLDKNSPAVTVKEAVDGDKVEPGCCYIAPGDFHMKLQKNMTLKLDQGPKVSFVRPSATVTFESVLRNFPQKTLSLVLTGMGDDGAAGVSPLVERGDYLYIQDEKSSVVWGMPGAAKQVCPNVKEIPLLQISDFLNKVIEKRNRLN